MPDVQPDLQPEGAEAGLCASCHQPIWWVITTAGRCMPLDNSPHAEGNIEMTRIGPDWRAEVLAQVESLFDVPRLRWRPHMVSCPDAARWRRRGHGQVPRQRER